DLKFVSASVARLYELQIRHTSPRYAGLRRASTPQQLGGRGQNPAPDRLRDLIADLHRALGAGEDIVDGAGAVFADQVFGDALRLACVEIIHLESRVRGHAARDSPRITCSMG